MTLRAVASTNKNMLPVLYNLTDQDIWEITNVTRPDMYPVLRAAMVAFALDSVDMGSEIAFYAAFMAMIDLPTTQTRTVMSPDDTARYQDVFAEVRVQFSKLVSLVNVTQVFGENDEYKCAWLTCTTGDVHFWVVVNDDWEWERSYSFDTTLDYVWDLVGGTVFSFSTFGNIKTNAPGWPQVFAGTRFKNEDAF